MLWSARLSLGFLESLADYFLVEFGYMASGASWISTMILECLYGEVKYVNYLFLVLLGLVY